MSDINSYYKDYFKVRRDEHYTMSSVADTSRVLGLIDSISSRQKRCDLILDVGCGDAHLSTELPDYNWSGMDITNDRAPHAVVHDLCQAPYPYNPNQFDAVVCTEVLEHLFSPEVVHKEVARILKPGGYYYVTTPNLESFDTLLMGGRNLAYNPSQEHSKEHIRQYDFETHKGMILPLGFDIEDFYGTDARMSITLKNAVNTLMRNLDIPEGSAELLLGRCFPRFCPGITLVLRKKL